MAPSGGSKTKQRTPVFTARDVYGWTQEERREMCLRLEIPVDPGETPEGLRRQLSKWLRHRSPPSPVHENPSRPHGRHPNSVATATESLDDTTGEQLPEPSKVTKGHASTSRAKNGGNAVAETMDDEGFHTPLRTAKTAYGRPRSPSRTRLGAILLDNPFQPLEEEDDNDREINTHLRMLRKHPLSPLQTPEDRPRVRPNAQLTPMRMRPNPQESQPSSVPFDLNGATGTQKEDTGAATMDTDSDGKIEDLQSLDNAHEYDDQHRTARNGTRADLRTGIGQVANPDTANAAQGAPGRSATGTWIPPKPKQKRAPPKDPLAGLTAQAIAKMEALPKRPNGRQLADLQDVGLKALL